MDTNLSTLIDFLPSNTLYVLVRWPFSEALKVHSWFDDQCVYYGTWDTESIIKAYFVPLARIKEIRDQGEPWLLLLENGTEKM